MGDDGRALDHFRRIEPGVRHGDPKFGEYTMAALHYALQLTGYDLRYLSARRSFQGNQVL